MIRKLRPGERCNLYADRKCAEFCRSFSSRNRRTLRTENLTMPQNRAVSKVIGARPYATEPSIRSRRTNIQSRTDELPHFRRTGFSMDRKSMVHKGFSTGRSNRCNSGSTLQRSSQLRQNPQLLSHGHDTVDLIRTREQQGIHVASHDRTKRFLKRLDVFRQSPSVHRTWSDDRPAALEFVVKSIVRKPILLHDHFDAVQRNIGRINRRQQLAPGIGFGGSNGVLQSQLAEHRRWLSARE